MSGHISFVFEAVCSIIILHVIRTLQDHFFTIPIVHSPRLMLFVEKFEQISGTWSYTHCICTHHTQTYSECVLLASTHIPMQPIGTIPHNQCYMTSRTGSDAEIGNIRAFYNIKALFMRSDLSAIKI